MLRSESQDPLTDGINANRTGASRGDSVSLSFTAGHVGDDANNYTVPSAKWFKDGIPVNNIYTNTIVGSNGRLKSTLSFTFKVNDAGVYQCLFMDNSTQTYASFPLRIDTGIL